MSTAALNRHNGKTIAQNIRATILAANIPAGLVEGTFSRALGFWVEHRRVFEEYGIEKMVEVAATVTRNKRNTAPVKARKEAVEDVKLGRAIRPGLYQVKVKVNGKWQDTL